MIDTLFWGSALTLVYTYIGYPILLMMRSLLVRRPVGIEPFQPSVTIVIAAHNEESRIETKLLNLLEVSYPKDKVQIIVVSDDSTDRTDAIVEEYKNRGVVLLKVKPRQGKHYAQKLAIDRSHSDIIVFTDAAPLLRTDSLERLVENFADSEVGCAGGEDRVLSGDSGESSEGLYIRYDMMIRKLESETGSSVGLSGAFFAARRELCVPWESDRSSDLQLTMQAVRRGFRAISDPRSIHHYTATESQTQEFRRKTRTIVNGMLVFADSLDLTNVFRYGFFSVQLLSHKLLRWIAPIVLLICFGTSLYLSPHSSFHQVSAWSQGILYAAAIVGLLAPPLQRYSVFRIPSFFVISHCAIAFAWIRVLAGRSYLIWNPTPRP